MNKEELKYLIIKNEIFQEIEKLKAQLYSKDQIKVTCPNCKEEIIVNQCRVVTNLQGRINKAIKYIEDTQFEAFDGMSENEVEEILDILKGRI